MKRILSNCSKCVRNTEEIALTSLDQRNATLLNSAQLINSIVPNAPFPYPLKTLENRKVFSYFQRVEKGCIGKE